MTEKSPDIAERMARFAGMTPVVRDGSFAFVYYATSWEAARKIALEGIDREAGRQNLDFGQRISFYVAKSFTMAARWAKLKRGLFNQQCAILVFTLPREQAENARLVWKTIEYPDPWKDIVTKSRAGQKTEIDKGVDFAEGPYLVDASVAPLTVNNCQPSKDFQIAAKTDPAVEFLYKNLIGTIYFSQAETDDHILYHF